MEGYNSPYTGQQVDASVELSQHLRTEAVRNIAQNFTEDQKSIARQNIGAIGQDQLSDLQAKINAVTLGARIQLFLSPAVIEKGVATPVVITALVEGGETASSISVKDGTTVVVSGSDTAMVTGSVTATLSDPLYKDYLCEVTYQGSLFAVKSTLYARNPIYCGFGANVGDVGIDINKVVALSSVMAYKKTSTASDQKLFLLVPDDVTPPSQFVMNGAPFVMLDPVNTILLGVNYKVYESANSYNAGTELTIEVR